jgi:hypothetical protein
MRLLIEMTVIELDRHDEDWDSSLLSQTEVEAVSG